MELFGTLLQDCKSTMLLVQIMNVCSFLLSLLSNLKMTVLAAIPIEVMADFIQLSNFSHASTTKSIVEHHDKLITISLSFTIAEK